MARPLICSVMDVRPTWCSTGSPATAGLSCPSDSDASQPYAPGTSMVRKGSPVRVRQRALRKAPLRRGFLCPHDCFTASRGAGGQCIGQWGLPRARAAGGRHRLRSGRARRRERERAPPIAGWSVGARPASTRQLANPVRGSAHGGPRRHRPRPRVVRGCAQGCAFLAIASGTRRS